eukprot:TRINITY_DN21872_c0_g1_i1.p1 TRINITY_DN21872_c0_g1~~TRINITY_DN21872_c0_g1_i1.p1  ORF type:complete len:629 (+),score=79.89 TRINITY_DN21872_c0_g1_i1:33-1889(+)
MLLYNNRSFLRIIFAQRGSVFYRRDNVITGLALSALCVAIQYMASELPVDYAPHIQTYYAIHALGGVVSFAVVFRTNLGWQRYWEGVTQLHIMYSKWSDAYTQVVAFILSTLENARAKGNDDADARAKCKRLETALAHLEVHFSLMSALAVDKLSHGDTRRMEKRAELVGWSKQIAKRHELRKEDLTGSRQMPSFRVASLSQKTMEQNPENQWRLIYVVKKVPTDFELEALDKSVDRVSVVMYWILHTLTNISKDLEIAPPIQSRMYQELSNGMLGFSQSSKLSDVPFPFPYAQILTLLLTAFSLFIPAYVALFTRSLIVGPIMSFLLYQGFWGVNEVAKELENPFGVDHNDVPLGDMHERFTDTLAEINAAHVAKLKLVADYETPEISNTAAHSSTVVAAGVEQSLMLNQTVFGSMPAEAFGSGASKLIEEDCGRNAVVTSQTATNSLKVVAREVTLTSDRLREGSEICGALPKGGDHCMTVSVSPKTNTDLRGAAEAPSQLSSDIPSQCLGRHGDVFDDHLTRIGRRMETHLGQIAQELEIGARMERHLRWIARELETISMLGRSRSKVAEGGMMTTSDLPCGDAEEVRLGDYPSAFTNTFCLKGAAAVDRAATIV